MGLLLLRLDTNHVLVEARRLYGRAGWTPIERYRDNRWATHFFEKRVAPPDAQADSSL